jgi:hypothetical protein
VKSKVREAGGSRKPQLANFSEKLASGEKLARRENQVIVAKLKGVFFKLIMCSL